METREGNSITTVSKKEYFAYFAYGFGQCFSFGLVGTFILFFYTDILGISAIAASTIFLIARVWDAVNDPMIASFMDTRKTKEGKFKGYLKIIPIFVVISTILCFISPDIPMKGKIIYALITYMLWGMVYTISDIPFWSLSAVISNQPEERTKLITVANLGVFGGIGMVGIILPPLAVILGKGNMRMGYLAGVIISMIIGYAFMLYGYKNIKERVKPAKAEKVMLKDVMQSLKSNNHMFKVLSIFFLNIFMNIVQGTINYFFIYNMNNQSLMIAFGFIGTASALGFFIIPSLTKKYSKKSVLSSILMIDIVVRIVFFMMGYKNVATVMVMITITQFLYAATAPIISAMLAETIEYSEVKTGKRCEAITFSGQTFCGKLSVALGGASTGILLTTIGYVPNIAQPLGTLKGLFIIISILPAIGSLIRLLILSTYKYTEEEYKKDLKILEQRRCIS